MVAQSLCNSGYRSGGDTAAANLVPSVLWLLQGPMRGAMILFPSDPQSLIEDSKDPDASNEEYIEGVTHSIEFGRHYSAEDEVSLSGAMFGEDSRVDVPSEPTWQAPRGAVSPSVDYSCW